jgi:hypothetical protein
MCGSCAPNAVARAPAETWKQQRVVAAPAPGRLLTFVRLSSEWARQAVREGCSFAKKQEPQLALLVVVLCESAPRADCDACLGATAGIASVPSAVRLAKRALGRTRASPPRRRTRRSGYNRVANDLATRSEQAAGRRLRSCRRLDTGRPRGGLALRVGVRIGSLRSAWMARCSARFLPSPGRCSPSLHQRSAQVGRTAVGRAVIESQPGHGEHADARDGGQPAG